LNTDVSTRSVNVLTLRADDVVGRD